MMVSEVTVSAKMPVTATMTESVTAAVMAAEIHECKASKGLTRRGKP